MTTELEMNETQDKLKVKQLAFVIELVELEKKHGVYVSGCCCCGSPYLDDDDKARKDSDLDVLIKELKP